MASYISLHIWEPYVLKMSILRKSKEDEDPKPKAGYGQALDNFGLSFLETEDLHRGPSRNLKVSGEIRHISGNQQYIGDNWLPSLMLKPGPAALSARPPVLTPKH